MKIYLKEKNQRKTKSIARIDLRWRMMPRTYFTVPR